MSNQYLTANSLSLWPRYVSFWLRMRNWGRAEGCAKNDDLIFFTTYIVIQGVQHFCVSFWNLFFHHLVHTYIHNWDLHILKIKFGNDRHIVNPISFLSDSTVLKIEKWKKEKVDLTKKNVNQYNIDFYENFINKVMMKIF